MEEVSTGSQAASDWGWDLVSMAKWILTSTGDDNVHPQNSIQYAAALEAAGKPFYMLLYPNRTHAISGGNSQAHLFESLTRFVREQL